MRIPFTRFGLPQVAIIPASLLLAMVGYFFIGLHFPHNIRSVPALAVPTVWLPELIMLSVFILVLSFFRDPSRTIPGEADILLSPADGTITDIETVPGPPDMPGKCLRIGIFLSIFNVHINRTPCPVRIERVTYKKGRFKNAMKPESGKVNESNDILMMRLNAPKHLLIVRQISGAIARRIVCIAKSGSELPGGYKFGMLKFGSRTELYLPMPQEVDCLVKMGDKVKAGQTILIRYLK